MPNQNYFARRKLKRNAYFWSKNKYYRASKRAGIFTLGKFERRRGVFN
ncbi:unnamed protein product [Acidithrix sp. C25]|nr:unnamed protein product [Acidithrix sp. C25]